MKFVIVSTVEKDDETDEPLFWNNDQGWVNFGDATRFEEKPQLTPSESKIETLN